LNHSTKEESKASDEAVIGLISPELKQSGVSIEVDGKRYSKQKGEEKIEGDPEEIPFVNTLAAERVARDIFPGVKVKTTTEPGVRGYYDIKTGEVYLNPELINTPEAAAEVLIEEIITHKGIDAVYRNKNKTKKLFKKVYADHKEEILIFREENKGLYGKQFDDLDIVVEEWMASKAIERGAISPTIAKTVSADIKRAFGASTKGDMTLVEEAVYRGLLKMRERRLESVLSKAGSAEKFTDEEFAKIKKLEKKKAWIEGEKKRAELKAKKVKELDKQREAIEESERLEKEWLEVEAKLKDKDDIRVKRGRERKLEGIRFSKVDPKQAEKERYTARQRRDKAIEKKIDSLLTKYQEDSANLHKPEETVQVKITIGGKEKTYKVDVNKKLNAIKDIAVVNRHMNALTELPADKRFDYLLNITDYQIGQVGKTIAYKAKLELDLELRNMKDFFKSNSNVRELYKASRGNSKNEDAIKVFNTIQNVFKKLMREHNLEGGRMAFLKEHVIPRVYSRDKILKEFGDHSINIKGKKTGLKESDKDMVRYKQRFINWYAGKLDLKKMYTDKGEEIPSPEDIERSLGGMFEAIVEDGKYQVDPVANSANLANKSAISRKIHFLNAEDDYLHDKLFGSEDTLAAIFNQIEQISTRTAMMRLLGTNPNRMIDELTDMSKDLLDDTGYVKSKSKFNKIASNMKAGLSVIDRSAQVSKFATANRIISNLKIISNLAKMGGLIFTSSSDPALKRLGLSRLEVDSKGVWKTMLNINPLEIRNKADKRVLENNIAMLEAAGDAMVYSRIDVDNIGASSVLSRLQHQFFNLNGMNMWNKWHRESFILGAVKRMGVNSQYSMKDLREMGGSSMLLDAFETSGISDSDWDLIRSVAKHIDRDNPDMMTPANGRGSDVYLTYDMVRNIDPEIVANYLGKDVKSLEVERYINELAGKYGSFLNEQMDSSILTPGVKEKRIINFNEAEGTAISLITKLFAQYKTFPITAWTKMSSKYKGKGLQQYLALVSAAGIATAIQMVAMNAREILTGRTARPWDTKLLSEAFLRSGVGGLGVDVLFGIANPEGNKTDVMSFLGGPALNMISDGVDMSLSQPYQSTFGEDTASDSLMRVAKFAKSWMPFNNHPLVKAMVVDPIFNMTADHLNPETLRRTESWYRKRGQKYIFNSPTGNEIPILSDELISGFDY